MPTTLLPQPFWFRLALRCPRVDGIPRAGKSGRLFDLPEACRLPDPTALDGKDPWADVRMAWNERGLAIQFSVSGKSGPFERDPALPEASDGVHLWIDTRDARDVHRATRFCHRYSATLEPRSGKVLDVEVALRKIHRAAAEPTGLRPETILSYAESVRGGWHLWMFLPSKALHGFDPDTNRRLGFTYQITDPRRGAQWLAVGGDFPVAEDPSLWSTLELVD